MVPPVQACAGRLYLVRLLMVTDPDPGAGIYTLNYHVTQNLSVPGVIPAADKPFWTNRTTDEPNDDLNHPTDLGFLSIPGSGQPAINKDRSIPALSILRR